MPDISLSPEQLAYIEAVREQLADEVTYGHVRTQDAVQYLIDHHEDTDDMDVDVEAEPDGGTLADAGSEESTAPEGDDSSGSSSVDDTVAALQDAGPGGDTTESDDETSGTGQGTETIGATDNEKVDEMMNLLATHDDKWTESDASGGKYTVELPDGDSETVMTKDDVRGVLFRHYR